MCLKYKLSLKTLGESREADGVGLSLAGIIIQISGLMEYSMLTFVRTFKISAEVEP